MPFAITTMEVPTEVRLVTSRDDIIDTEAMWRCIDENGVMWCELVAAARATRVSVVEHQSSIAEKRSERARQRLDEIELEKVSRWGSECVCAVSKSGPFTKSIGCSRGRLIRVRTTADACSRIADDRAEWERAHPEDEKATVRGICTYCGEIIRESSTGPKAFEVLYEDFDELTYCRGVWWMRALGGDHWRRCHWWNVNDLATLACKAGKSIVEFKQCLRCGGLRWRPHVDQLGIDVVGIDLGSVAIAGSRA